MTQIKTWTAGDVADLLTRSDDAVKRAIRQLSARAAELAAEDVEFITDIARKLPRYNNNMTPRQLGKARRVLPRYLRQLLEEIEKRGSPVDYGPKSLNREVADSSIAEHIAMKQMAAAAEAEQEAKAMEAKLRSKWGMF
jgi:hypothetical protein